jgi:hypothetical protein
MAAQTAMSTMLGGDELDHDSHRGNHCSGASYCSPVAVGAKYPSAATWSVTLA